MTRIIAGFAGSQRLAVPRAGTRPTSDRVREAIFSALDARGLISGSIVLDLYAGSGALGLEAASRGAHSVTLVENNARAARSAQTNATIILDAAVRGNRPQIEVVTQSVSTFLISSRTVFDIVFVDPPYDLGEEELGETLKLAAEHLVVGAVVVVERSGRSPTPTLPAGLALDRRTNYGETTVWWLRHETRNSQPAIPIHPG